MLSERGCEVAHTIDHGRPAGQADPGEQHVWSDLDLELADARIVAELARRVEIWAALAGSANAELSVPAPQHILSDPTVRELLAVVEILTRRETARLTARRRPR
jgi:hypothetical protein